MKYGNCRTSTAAYFVFPNELVRHELKVLGVDGIGDQGDVFNPHQCQKGCTTVCTVHSTANHISQT